MEFIFIHNWERKWKLCADTAAATHNNKKEALGYLITSPDIEVSASSIENLIRIFPIYALIYQPECWEHQNNLFRAGYRLRMFEEKSK